MYYISELKALAAINLYVLYMIIVFNYNKKKK